MIKKNDVLTEYVVDIGANGEGIVKKDGLVIFIPFALKGELCSFKILKVTSKVCYAKLLNVLEPSKDRVSPVCPVFTKCGGCSIQHLNYASQLEIKKQNVINCFKKIAGLDLEVTNVISSDFPLRYRNKLQLPVSFDGEKTVIGFYAENSHRVVEIADCPINKEYTKDIISIFNNFIAENNFKGYFEREKKGDIREITVKEISGILIITVVWLKLSNKGLNGLINSLEKAFGDNFSLFYNVNDKNTNVIYGDKFYLMHGNGEVLGEKLGIKISSGVLSFSQVNDNVCDKLYTFVTDEIKSFNPDTVVDAYSGAGLMTAMLSRVSKKAIGIEIVKEATLSANSLKDRNNLSDKMININGACEEVLPDLVKKEFDSGSKIAVVLDPPRKGCDVKVLNAIKKCKIDKIVYVSCLPSSLARDVGILVGSLKMSHGEIVKDLSFSPEYSIDKICLFDMFPQTKHVETLVVLQRK